MSRDMCKHGFDLREHACVDCLVARGNANEIISMFWAMRGERDREIAAERTELAALRLIVTEKFAGADMYVKPEDAADVARWAAHPEAVRELLRHDPAMEETGYEGAAICPRCDAGLGQPHNMTSRIDRPGLRFSCPVAAAWRALGDPRGAADIERAWEEALREQERRAVVRGRLSITQHTPQPWDVRVYLTRPR